MALHDELQQILGPRGLVAPADMAERHYQPGSQAPGRTAGLLRPASTEELARVLAACHAQGQPLVTQGGLTGLVDGAVPLDGEYILSLERMAVIEDLDAAGRTVRVQAGARVQQVQELAAAHQLQLAVDWGARGSATVGGAIATNAGGNSVLRFGMMREQVLGLEVVLADGTVVSALGALLKDNAGYDLKQLFIGSEGTLGIITRAVLRLRPAPRARHAALVAVACFADVVALLNHLDAGLGGQLTAFEVMWRDFYELMTGPGRCAPPLAHGHPFYVLLEASGGDPAGDADRLAALLAHALEKGLLLDATLAASEARRQAFWAIREDVAVVFRELDPPVPFDVSLPLRAVEDFVARMTHAVQQRWPSARRTVFGHLGDNNLHFIWGLGDPSPAARKELARLVYDMLQPIGGSVSAEHGVGLQKKPYLDRSRSINEIALMQSLKRWLDPRGILNPGRVA